MRLTSPLIVELSRRSLPRRAYPAIESSRYEVHSLEQQCKRAYSQLQERPSALAKYTCTSDERSHCWPS